MSNINKLNKEFIEKINEIYSKEDIKICLEWFNTEKRNTSFRINNLKKDSKKIVLDFLEKNNIEYKKIQGFNNTYKIISWDEKILWDSEIIKDWYIYLQSISSQIPVEILDIKENAKVLDLTAAPGGKTSQAADKMKNSWSIIANELNAIRIEKLKFTLERQWVKNTKIIKNDARNILKNNSTYKEYFDYIIADLPCSAEWKFNTNIEKSHAYWSTEVVKKNYKLQKQIIQNSIDLLKKWWELVYSTCTISPEENEDICHMILCNFPQMQIQEINFEYEFARPGLTKFQNKHFKKEIEKTIRVLPSVESEWFFLAKFKKITD